MLGRTTVGEKRSQLCHADLFWMSLGLRDVKSHMGSCFYPGARSGGKPPQSGLAKLDKFLKSCSRLEGEARARVGYP